MSLPVDAIAELLASLGAALARQRSVLEQGQLDQLASQSLLKWKFVALPVDQYREEVGTITFNFSVR
jgi:hypothetical protein